MIIHSAARCAVLLLCALALAVHAKTVTGMVRSTAQDTPAIEGAAVRLIAVHPGGGEDTLRDTTLADGAFAFDNIAAECALVRIRASKRSFASVDTVIALTSESSYLRIDLAPSLMGRLRRVVVSTIVDGQGTPVPGAAIRLYALGFGSPLIFYDTTRTSGISTIDSIAEACTYCNCTVATDHASADTTFQFSEDTTRVTIALPSIKAVCRRWRRNPTHEAPQAGILLLNRSCLTANESANVPNLRRYFLNGRCLHGSFTAQAERSSARLKQRNRPGI